MEIVDWNVEDRQAWLRGEQQPRITPEILQSNFEQSPYWRVCLFIATLVIGIQVFSPEPDAVPTSPAPTAVQSGHVRPVV